MSDKKYVSINRLQTFLNNLKNIFANKSHTHTKNEITDFNVQEIVDEVLRQIPAAEESEF